VPAGVGKPLPLDRTRRLLALRINVLAKGHSGVRPETVEKMLAFLNNNCLSLVPEQGSVGASGDLAPLCYVHPGPHRSSCAPVCQLRAAPSVARRPPSSTLVHTRPVPTFGSPMTRVH
jgi:hypothetical protein